MSKEPRSKLRKSAAPSGQEDATEEVANVTDPRRHRLKTLAKFAAAPLVLVVATAVVADINGWLTRPPDPRPQLELDYVTYTPPQYALRPFSIEMELRNTGRQLAIITALRMEIQQRLVMPICFTQGDLPISGRLVVNVPKSAKPGMSFVVP